MTLPNFPRDVEIVIADDALCVPSEEGYWVQGWIHIPTLEAVVPSDETTLRLHAHLLCRAQGHEMSRFQRSKHDKGVLKAYCHHCTSWAFISLKSEPYHWGSAIHTECKKGVKSC